MMDDAFLRLDNVSLFYDHIHALHEVSLRVREGETIALIGANGAGKSSILRAITGLHPISGGAIYYDGARLDGKDPSEVVGTGISMVPEGRRVFPYMSVKDNLLMGAFMRTNKAEVAADLEKMMTNFPRLRERFYQSAGTMSGGEQQMVAICRALMARPKLLLMDEPSLGLAPIIVREIAVAITEINKNENLSIILVEQNSRMALKISSYAYVMETGRIGLEGASKDLSNDPHVIKLYLGG